MQTNPDLLNLLHAQNGPFLTLLVKRPTNPASVNQAKLTFKNLLKMAATMMEKSFPNANWENYQSRFTEYQDNNDFWLSGTGKTVALIGNEHQIFTYHLNRELDDHVSISHRPNILPIINEELEFNYLVLALNHDSFILYRGDQHHLLPINLPADAPDKLTKALGEEIDGKSVNVSARGHEPGFGSFHGHNEKSAEIQKDKVNYYQQVADYVLKNFAQYDQRKVILFGLPENQTIFKQVAKSNLIDEKLHIDLSPAKTDFYEVEKQVLNLMSQWFDSVIAALSKDYEQAASKQLLVDEPYNIVEPVMNHQVDQLIITSGATARGLLLGDGNLITNTPEASQNNLLNDLAIFTILRGGNVITLTEDQLPAKTRGGGVALLRYAQSGIERAEKS